VLISGLIEYAARYHPDVEIVSRTCEGPVVRTSYADLRSRAAKLAKALIRLGVSRATASRRSPGTRIGHMELYFAVSGLGAVLHTSIRGCFPSRSNTSSITPKTACCSSFLMVDDHSMRPMLSLFSLSFGSAYPHGCAGTCSGLERSHDEGV